MLVTIGVDSVDRLFDSIPKSVRLDRLLALPAPWSEIEVRRLLRRPGREERLDRRQDLVPRRRRLSALPAGLHRPAAPARRVPHGLHAVSAGGLPGDAAGDLRVPDAPVPADGARRRERLALRRLDRVRRGGPARRERVAKKKNRLVLAEVDPPAVPRDACGPTSGTSGSRSSRSAGRPTGGSTSRRPEGGRHGVDLRRRGAVAELLRRHRGLRRDLGCGGRRRARRRSR